MVMLFCVGVLIVLYAVYRWRCFFGFHKWRIMRTPLGIQWTGYGPQGGYSAHQCKYCGKVEVTKYTP